MSDTEMQRKFPLTSEKSLKLIRAAWSAGRKTVTIDKVTYSIAKQTKRVTYVIGGVTKRRNESWLVVKPVRGGNRVANIELSPQANMRTVTVK